MPNLANALVMAKYKIPVSAIPADKAQGNEIPLRSIHGIRRNIGKDGSTYQKVPSAWSAILTKSLVSPYIQIIPSTETSGKDAIKLPKSGSFLEISEITTMIPAEMNTLVMYQAIGEICISKDAIMH